MFPVPETPAASQPKKTAVNLEISLTEPLHFDSLSGAVEYALKYIFKLPLNTQCLRVTQCIAILANCNSGKSVCLLNFFLIC